MTRYPGSPRITDIVADAITSMRAHRASTVTAILVAAIVCLVIMVTTGQSAAAEATVISRIDSEGSRLLVVVDETGHGHIQPHAVQTITTFSDVTWAFGVSEAHDVVNKQLFAAHTGAPARYFLGELPEPVTLEVGRLPQPGEAIIGSEAAQTLALQGGMGTVVPTTAATTGQLITHDARQTPTVGVFHANPPLDSLNRAVLISAPRENPPELLFVYVLADNISVLSRLNATLSTSVPAWEPETLLIDTPHGAADLQAVIAGDLGRSSRILMLTVLGVGIAIIAVTTWGHMTQRRREFGRRRALGATRSVLVATVLIQTTLSALLGTMIGVALTLVIGVLTPIDAPPPTFIASVGTLVILIAMTGAIPPAVAAAYRDPMRILRVP